MSKSRMFDDDEPESPHPSPRTTIVGGRPPEDSAETHPVPTGIQSLLRLAAEDPSFEREFLERRGDIADPAGVKLTESEKAILKTIPDDQLTAMIHAIPPAPAPRRDFLRKTAATAVLLLGGAALDGCDSCSGKVTGARPDVPPDRPDERPSPPGGARPDVPEPKPEPPVEKTDGQFAKPPQGWDGGTPEPPPEEPPEPPPERPDKPSQTRGIRPDRPRPTKGHRSDVPPKKKEKPQD